MKKLIWIALIIAAVLWLSSGCIKYYYYSYYAEKDNYITVTGTISHLKNSEESGLFLAFDNLSVNMADNNFCIKGSSHTAVLANGIMDKLSMGDRVIFVTAPHYFGDGYTMPIVAIHVDGEWLLTFEEGYAFLLEDLLK